MTREGFAGGTALGLGAGMRGASKARLSACAITASLSAGWAAPSSNAATSLAGAAHPAARAEIPAVVPAATQSRGQLAPSDQIDGFAAAGSEAPTGVDANTAATDSAAPGGVPASIPADAETEAILTCVANPVGAA